jgi:hypothetical protein
MIFNKNVERMIIVIREEFPYWIFNPKSRINKRENNV